MEEILRRVLVNEANVESASALSRKAKFKEQERDVRRIVREVRKNGDKALISFSRRFEWKENSKEKLLVSNDEIKSARENIKKELLDSMQECLSRLRFVQEKFLESFERKIYSNGFEIERKLTPLSSAGCYVPGGNASYASTLIMTAGLARIAGVSRVVVCTPPDRNGRISSAILAAASLCGVSEVYRVGGAQSVAALAYGTETIKPVQKIFGPGGIYVSIAKRIVSSDVQVDFFAGPTELLMLIDDSADPRLVAWDIVAQAEHGAGSNCSVVTWSEGVAEKVRKEIIKILPGIRRREQVVSCLRESFSFVCDGKETAARLVNSIAPEHLEVIVSDDKMLERVRNAGLILVGEYSPCAASDYLVGTCHVIPTNGYASVRSSLSVLDFMVQRFIVKGSRDALAMILNPLKEISYAEGLENHYLSVLKRFES